MEITNDIFFFAYLIFNLYYVLLKDETFIIFWCKSKSEKQQNLCSKVWRYECFILNYNFDNH